MWDLRQSQVIRESLVYAQAKIRERTDRALRRNAAWHKKQREATQKRIDLEKISGGSHVT